MSEQIHQSCMPRKVEIQPMKLRKLLAESLNSQIMDNVDQLLAEIVKSNGETIKYQLQLAAKNEGVVAWDVDAKISATRSERIDGQSYCYDPAQPELPNLGGGE